jgi:hypothetical protein
MKNKQKQGKEKCSDLKRMWHRAAKKPKVTSTSTPTPIPSEVENQNQDDNVTSPPSNELQLALLQTHNDGGREPEIGSPVVEDEVSESDDEVSHELEHDPGKRTPIINYDVNDQDVIRRRFIALGPCQPKQHDFPIRDIGGNRRFKSHWFEKFNWLEYSVELDAVFCFVCYLFKDETKHKGGDSFVKEGFRNWNVMNDRLKKHCGGITSAHCEAQEKYDLFIQPSASIRESIASSSKTTKAQYFSRLSYSIFCLRFLLKQGLAFRGHDESEDSFNKGIF